MSTSFHFEENQFCRLFPFFILIDRALNIVALGKSIPKVYKVQVNNKFDDVFSLKRPQINLENLDTLLALQDQLVIIESRSGNDAALRGQIEYLKDEDCALFIGSPWFGSMNQVSDKGLTLHDFAIHDPLIDLLHVLKTQEMVNDDIKKLLLTVTKQRKDLVQLSLVAEQILTAVVITNAKAEIEWANNGFLRITGYHPEEVIGLKPGSFLQGKDTNPDTVVYIRERMRNGEPFTCELINYTKDGTPYWIKITCQALRNKMGVITQYFAIQEDITIQKELEIKIEEQRKFYEDILNNMPADIAVFNTKHQYLFVNPMAIRNPAIRQWMIGKRDEDYVQYRNKPETIAQKRRQLFEGVMQSKKIHSWEEEMIRPDGSKEYVFRNLFPVLDKDGNVELIIGYGLDITELKKVQLELELSREKTEEQASAKQQFLANMSHEIRTPMNGILGISGLFEKTKLDSQQQELLDIIQESAKNLLMIVNDVLDLEKIISGKVEMEKIPFNLADKVYLTTESFRFKAKEKNIKLLYQNHLPANLVVQGDPFRLSQVLNNIISNAVKFTERGSVLVSTTLKDQQADQLQIAFTVKDTGIGINPDRQEDIFEPFMQANADTTRRFGGTGLGLSICRELVRMLGGTISLESEESIGSTFYFEIPFQLSTAVIPTSKKRFVEIDLVKKLRILVAEDVDINQFLIRHILQSWDCRFTLVENGKLALDALMDDDYDLVLMDIQMQEMDGLEATAAIRALPDPVKANIPVIALTANVLRGDFETYKAAGMDDYLPKPFNGADLYDVILRVWEKKDNNDNALTMENQTQAIVLYDLSLLESMSQGDQEFIRKMVTLFLNTMPPLQNQLQLAAEAANWPEVSRAAHKMKPTIDSMGIKTIKTTIRTVEQNAKASIMIDALPQMIAEINLTIDTCLLQLKQQFDLT